MQLAGASSGFCGMSPTMNTHSRYSLLHPVTSVKKASPFLPQLQQEHTDRHSYAEHKTTSKEALTSYLPVSQEAPLEKQCKLQQMESRVQRSCVRASRSLQNNNKTKLLTKSLSVQGSTSSDPSDSCFPSSAHSLPAAVTATCVYEVANVCFSLSPLT